MSNEPARNLETPPPAPKAAGTDYAHVPMGEEFDRAKWTLPPITMVLIAVGILAVVAAIVALSFKPKQVNAGSIDQVAAVETQDKTSVFVPVHITLRNIGQRTLWIQKITAQLKTDQGEWSDEPANEVDYQRYFQAYPDLKQYSMAALQPEQKIPAGAEAQGMILVSFPVTKDAFDHRKSLTVTIQPYDRVPLVLTK